MSSSVTSRCVTARRTVGWIVAESATPCSASRAIASSFESGATSIWTKFVSTRIGVDGEPGLGEPQREPLRTGMVVGEPVDVVVERIDASGRDDAGLAHRAAEEVLQAPCVRHHLGIAGEDRAQRAAEPLREAERDGVEARADLGRVDPERDRCVQQAGAVEVETQIELERKRVQLADLLQRPDPAAARVVGVLDPEQARSRRVNRRDAVRGAGLLGAVAAGHAREAARDDAGVDGRPAELGDEDVAVLLADQLVAELGVQADRDLVRHRRGRQEDRLVLAEQLRHALLELVDRRILAPLLVADRCGSDRGAHRGRRSGGGVRAEVDHAWSLAALTCL